MEASSESRAGDWGGPCAELTRARAGVAILSQQEPVVTRRTLPGDKADVQSRYIEAAISGIIGCIYLPNGNPQPGPKFDYKLKWFNRNG